MIIFKDISGTLSAWGRWALRNDGNALGFAASSILAQSGDGDGYDSSIPLGVSSFEHELVDLIINRKLPPKEKETVIVVYKTLHGKSDRKICAYLGIHHETFHNRLNNALRLVGYELTVLVEKA